MNELGSRYDQRFVSSEPSDTTSQSATTNQSAQESHRPAATETRTPIVVDDEVVRMRGRRHFRRSPSGHGWEPLLRMLADDY